MHDIRQILKTYWGYEHFRPFQEDIIHSVLDNRDTLALLPTGGGKSVCYQVPALAVDGICLVISPLIALMKDQVDNLKKKGILAAAIYSGMSRRQIVQTLKNVAHGPYKILYVSPERLETQLFSEYLPALDVRLIAVDEAHCISQWGYDFRPSYLKIIQLREELPDVPILALTASATPDVQEDICEKLGFRHKNIIRQSFERKNLSYSSIAVDAKLTKLIDILKKVQGSAIVYCRSRKSCVEIAGLLQLQGMSADYYHAGLSADQRNQKQNDWVEDKLRVMVCTNAFGMGIDKADVRLVIHMDVPDNISNYYQEAGRAGRDGLKSYAVLLYNEIDLEELREQEKIRYPDLDEIKTVYQALGNYLQVGVYSGQGMSYNFRLDGFIKAFSLNSRSTLYALKALEQDGWIAINENSFIPSTVVFTTTKDELYQFQSSHREFEPLLTTLLRTYEGVFDFPARISEQQLARLLKLEETEVVNLLRKIQSFRVIEYVPQSDEPQLILLKNRVAAEDLTFNLNAYHKRQKQFRKRVEEFIDYAKTTNCRSQYINQYFGDNVTQPCNICDNCISLKKKSLTDKEFEQLLSVVIEKLNHKPFTIHDLVQDIKLSKEKMHQVINFLQTEQKVSIDENGLIRLLGNTAPVN